MSLAVRLLVALGLLALLTTAGVGIAARQTARTVAEEEFSARIEAATQGTKSELGWQSTALAQLLGPMCRHDSFVDRALVDLERSHGKRGAKLRTQLSSGQRIAIKKLVSDQARALGLNRLELVLSDGRIVASSAPGRAGKTDSQLAAKALPSPGVPILIERSQEYALQVHCSRTSGPITLMLIGARPITTMLGHVGSTYGVELHLGEPPVASERTLTRRVTVPEVQGLVVHISMSRAPLFEALARIDSSILAAGAIALLLSVAVAVMVARGLAMPLVELAQQTRRVVQGEPRAVQVRGGREVEQLAKSFNRTLADLAHMRKRLARTERIAARREIARQVAHEIKNPLAPIRAAVETLRRLRDRKSPKFDEYFDEATRTVLSEVHRIRNIVNDFAKYARLPQPKFAELDLAAVVKDVVTLHDGSAITGGARVKLDAESLPKVRADRDQLIQILTNLIQNGIEAAKPHRPNVKVDVTLKRHSSTTCCLTVTDNGPGIDADVLERLFEPYVTTKSEGTGLGLAIVQTIVHEHGGEVRAESSDGGASFHIILPFSGPSVLEQPREDGEIGATAASLTRDRD